jgi:PhoH-like ATPase
VVSKDVTIWTLGDLLGVEVQDYTKDQTRPVDELLQGCVDITTSKEVIDLLYENEVVRVNGNAGLLSQAARTLAPNACCRLIASIFGKEKTALVVYKQVLSEFRDHIQDSPVSAGFRLVRKPDKHEKIGHLGPRNEEQSLALELLDDDDIKLVILAGKAGTGKSLLAFATGIKKVVIKKMYDRLIVVRPTIEAGVKGGVGGLGFIPGTLEEKLEPWMNAAADCISFALNGSGVTLSDLVRDGRVILKSVHHDRGITSRRSFVVIDEGQNLDPTTTKMMLTRPDDETKVVLTGDPYQIDNPHLGPQSNGLARALEDLPGHPLVGALTLRQCVRGELAAYVADKYSL